LILLVGALFALPFIFFSMTGGYFADRYSKRSVTIGTKLLELGVMAFTITGLYLRNLPMECGLFSSLAWKQLSSAPRSTACCRSCFRRNDFPGANGIIELERCGQHLGHDGCWDHGRAVSRA